ncbi:MAG: ribonuclease H-like domain-containing protein [Anaerolineales bacterium]
MKLAAFDLEIAAQIPDGVDDWSAYEPLGISCAAVALGDVAPVKFWSGVPRMTREDCQQLVWDLIQLEEDGYTLVTWNGCGFDFRVLAQESGMVEECGRLAFGHVDLMLVVTFTKGWYLSLQKALEGAGLSGKLKHVALSDGSAIDEMNGAQAPGLWAAGEHEAVLAYLEQDVVQLLALAEQVAARGEIRWTSNKGNLQRVPLSRLLTVQECFRIPEPDTSWMTDPPTREQFVAWIGGESGNPGGD